MQDKYDFEKQLRQELKNYKVPDGYKERMKQLCDKLPEKKILSRRQVPILRFAMTVCIVFGISTVTAMAGIFLVSLGNGKIHVSDGTIPYKKIVKIEEIQENNGQVNIRKKDKGIIYQIDNVGLDQGNLIIYYTVKNNKKLQLPEKNLGSKEARLNEFAVNPQIILDNREINTMPVSNIVYQKDEQTIKGVLRQNLSRKLEKRVQIEINPTMIMGIKGNWKINFIVDRSTLKEQSTRYVIRKGFVESIVLSPLGNTLEIKDGYKNRDFVLLDSDNNLLYTKVDSIQEKENSYYNFFTKRKKNTSFVIVPIKDTLIEKEKGTILLKEEEKIKFSKNTVLNIKKVQKRKNYLRVYMDIASYDGIDIGTGIDAGFLEGVHGKITSKGLNSRTWIDYETDQVVLELYDTEGQINFCNVKKIKYLMQDVILDEEHKIKITL